MNSSNGANGSRSKSRSIARRDRMFRLTRESEDEMAVMNWEMLTALGQLAAVVVGIPSLIYLALQIRAQTQERRQSAVNELTTRWGDAMSAFHDNREFSAIYLRGMQSFQDLDAVSKVQISAFFNRNFKNFQAIYFAHRHGMLPEPLWGEVERTMADLMA